MEYYTREEAEEKAQEFRQIEGKEGKPFFRSVEVNTGPVYHKIILDYGIGTGVIELPAK